MIAENRHKKTEVNYQVVQHSTHHSKRPHRLYHISIPVRSSLQFLVILSAAIAYEKGSAGLDSDKRASLLATTGKV